MLQEHVKTTKTDKTRFFFAKKKMNLLLNKQLLFNVPFQSTKYRKEQLCMDNKVQETIRDVYCPTCRNEKCVYISTNKTTSFYDCKKCKACCNALNIFFMDQKPTTMLFGGDGTHCFAKRRVATTKKKSHLHVWIVFFTSHNQADPDLNQKRHKLFQLWYNRADTPFVDTVIQNFIYIINFYTFSLH